MKQYAKIKVDDLDKMMRHVDMLENELYICENQNGSLVLKNDKLTKENQDLLERISILEKENKQMKIKMSSDEALIKECLRMMDDINIISVKNSEKRFYYKLNKIDERV